MRDAQCHSLEALQAIGNRRVHSDAHTLDRIGTEDQRLIDALDVVVDQQNVAILPDGVQLVGGCRGVELNIAREQGQGIRSTTPRDDGLDLQPFGSIEPGGPGIVDGDVSNTIDRLTHLDLHQIGSQRLRSGAQQNRPHDDLVDDGEVPVRCIRVHYTNLPLKIQQAAKNLLGRFLTDHPLVNQIGRTAAKYKRSIVDQS